jgi:hypothetical protein
MDAADMERSCELRDLSSLPLTFFLSISCRSTILALMMPEYPHIGAVLQGYAQ